MDDAVDDTDRGIYIAYLLKWLKKDSIYNSITLQMAWHIQYSQEALLGNFDIRGVHGQ